LSFEYSSTCFGHPHAHHQELQSSVAASALSLVIVVLLVVIVLSPSSDCKPEAATSVVVAPDDGRKDARNMLSCIQMTSNKLENLLHLVG
jgi:hypothetical protein